jgi:copper chaperone CopZ
MRLAGGVASHGRMTAPVNRTLALLCAPLLALGLSACSNANSTAAFKGEAHAVAQTVSNLQTDATARNEQKVCANDLSSAVVTRLDSAKEGCEQAIKNQLNEVDTFELTVESVQVNASGTPPTASARVKSVNAGKTVLSTVTLVKEGGKWKISSISS